MPAPQSPSVTVNGWAVAGFRVLTGTSRAELAKIIGLDVSTISRLERGLHGGRVRPDVALRLTRWVASHGIDRRAVIPPPPTATAADAEDAA